MFADRLKLARKGLDCPCQALSERLSPGFRSNISSSRGTGATDDALVVGPSRCGKALDVSLDFLMSGRSPELSGVEFLGVAPGTSDQGPRTCQKTLVVEVGRLLAIEDILGLKTRQSFRGGSVQCCGNRTQGAGVTPRRWELDDPIPASPISPLKEGVKVIETNNFRRFDGLACAVKRTGVADTEVVVISSRTNIERKRFNLAHRPASRHQDVADPAAMKLEKAMHPLRWGHSLAPADHLHAKEVGGQHRITYHELIG